MTDAFDPTAFPPPPEVFGARVPRVRGEHLRFRLQGPKVGTRPGHWLEPLATMLNTAYHSPEIAEAVFRGDPAPIASQAMSFRRADGAEADASDREEFRARTGRDLPGDCYLAEPSWLRRSSWAPRSDVLAVLTKQV